MACSWLINGGDPNHLLTGMALQELGDHKVTLNHLKLLDNYQGTMLSAVGNSLFSMQ